MSESVAHNLAQTANSYPLTISLFGQLRIFVNGKPADPFRLNKSRALLAYLLVEGATPHLRTDLAALLWSGYTPASALVSLRQTLNDLRKALAPFDLLHTTRNHVTLPADPARLWCDVQQFQQLLAARQKHHHDALASCSLCQAQLQQAVVLAQGTFLEQLPETGSAPFDAWLQAQRRHFAEQVTASQAALATTVHRLGNLRPALTTLIGRTTELADLVKQVQHPTYRCLTLIGPGGVGKTRLARALGAAVQATFADGVWLASLATISQPATLTTNAPPTLPAVMADDWLHDRIATAIADALGIQLQSTVRPSVAVATYLRDKSMLLILDNFEQLAAGVDWLLTLLETAPRLRLVITSRHRLPLHAQIVYAVEGLPVPPLDDTATASAATDLTQYASIQLFLERAANAQIDLTLDGPTLTTISQLCRLVAGLPLAIELAVAMLDRQKPVALLAAIRNNYRALREGWRDLPPRHRSAEAVLRSAWQLLTADEAALLARCAVFRGGFTADALQAIGPMNAADWQALHHKSLVHPTGADRFSLHELVRQFAAEQLAHTPTTEATVQERHAAYYIALAQAQERALLCDFIAQETLQGELDNLRAAWQWSVAQGNLALLAQGADSFFTLYGLACLYHEAIQQLESAIAHLRQLPTATATDAPVLRLLALLLTYAADFYQRTGALTTSEQMGAEALALGQGLADPAVQASAYNMLMRVAHARFNLPVMQSLATAGCTQARLAQRFDLLSKCLSDLGICFLMQQEMAAATAAFEEGVQALESAPNRYLEAQFLANLGHVRFSTKEYELARRYLQKSHDLHQTLRDQETRVSTQLMLGDLWRVIGVYPAAQQAYEQVQTRLQRAANPYSVSWLQIGYGYWHHLCGDPATAITRLTLGRQTAQQSGNRLFEAIALFYLGYVLIEGTAWAKACACFEQSLALQTDALWLMGTVDVHAGLAICLQAQGEEEAAVTQVDRVLHLLARHGVTVAAEPFLVYWLCFQVLQRVADARAQEVLHTAYQRLQACAAQFEDSALHHAFLNNVAVNRRLVMAAHAAGLS